jgi:branched-chain amino acid aminotransferase
MTTTSTTGDAGTTARPAPSAPFGSVFSPLMAVSRFDGASWSDPTTEPIESFRIHPGAHALHYGSACFEGLKAHRQVDGSARPFRADAHAARMAQSAGRLCLPVPPNELTERLIDMAVEVNEDTVPDSPGALYLRPTLLGMDETIGAAAHPSRTAILFVLACPVGDYLPPRPLTIAVETQIPRTTPQFGVVKAGANYAMALTPIMAARERYEADQVLFAPGGIVQETGASNIVLVDGDHLVTPELTDAYLHGITRDSLLKVARSMGWTVEEREISVEDVVEWIARPGAELALTGTAAVVGAVGTLIVAGEPLSVGTTGGAPRTAELRRTLIEIQTGERQFDFS